MTIALLAGGGDLPLEIVKNLIAQNLNGQKIIVVGFNGQTNQNAFSDFPLNFKLFSLGCIGEILSYLKHHQVTKIVLAGNLKRPNWSELKLDKTGALWLKKLGWRALMGDDNLLSGLLGLLEGEGFEIIKPASIIKNLHLPLGCLTISQPTPADLADINRGVEILNAIAVYDIGQAIIVQRGLVLGIEGAEGTDCLIQRCGLLRHKGDGGCLVKIAKQNQDNRVDLPTIGPQTINQLRDAGINGLAVSSTTTQIINLEEVINNADQAGIFILSLHTKN